MSGSDAVKQLLAEAAREEFVSLSLLARALRQDRRRILRDWKNTRHLPVTQIGREVLLASSLVVSAYFPHATSGTSNHSR